MKRFGLLFLFGIVACGRTETPKKKDENKPVDTQADKKDPPPAKTRTTVKSTGTGGGSGATGGSGQLDGGTCAKAGSTDAFSGDIAQLRQSGRASGTKVSLSDVVITGISGDKKAVYVSDQSFAAFSGIQLNCKNKTDCEQLPKQIGARINVEGVFNVTKDCLLMRIVSPITVTDLGTTAAVQTLSASTADVTGTSSNEPLRGSKLIIEGSEFVVSDVAPAAAKNDSFDEQACNATTASAKTCCKKGPKYRAFEVTVDGGGKFLVSTSMFPGLANNKIGFSLSAWPCDGGAPSVKVGDKFTAARGVFDINFGKPEFSPTADSDMPKVGGGSPGSTGITGSMGGTGQGGSTGTTDTPVCEAPSGPQSDAGSNSCCTCSGSCGSYSCDYSCDCSCPGVSQALYCTECTRDANCGGEGNFCILDDGGNGRCGKYCESDDDCGMDNECDAIYGEKDDQTVFFGMNCFPISGYCCAK